jgi:hypothetical protein
LLLAHPANITKITPCSISANSGNLRSDSGYTVRIRLCKNASF